MVFYDLAHLLRGELPRNVTLLVQNGAPYDWIIGTKYLVETKVTGMGSMSSLYSSMLENVEDQSRLRCSFNE
jgi:hypothetical protein